MHLEPVLCQVQPDCRDLCHGRPPCVVSHTLGTVMPQAGTVHSIEGVEGLRDRHRPGRLSRAIPAATHAALVLDRAGWHVSEDLTVPANPTLVPLPPYSPELNPVERVWEYLRD